MTEVRVSKLSGLIVIHVQYQLTNWSFIKVNILIILSYKESSLLTQPNAVRVSVAGYLAIIHNPENDVAALEFNTKSHQVQHWAFD